MSSAMNKNALYTVAILSGLIITALIILTNADPVTINHTANTYTTGIIEADLPENTIATVWQWDTGQSNEDQGQKIETSDINQPTSQSDNTSDLPFTQESVYKALHAVKLDDNGDIIIDDDALTALDTTLNHNQLKLDDEALEELQSMIRKGLPGNAGEQTAEIVANYYQYLGATSEFNSLYDTRNSSDQTIDDYETQYNELLALRELYLGEEVANQLFKTSNANSQYMFDSMVLEANTSLSVIEKKQQQAKIIERHAEKTINVDNWNVRFREFLNDKQNVRNSYLSDDDKRDQITSLMHQHFTDEELKYVNHLRLDSL